MFEIYGQITDDKSFKLDKKVFGNKLDNSISKVIINSISEEGNLKNKYVAFYSPKKDLFLFPLNSEDNSFIITTTITQHPGSWKILYLSTNSEIVDGVIDTDYKVFISNVSDFSITDNFLDETIEDVIPDENLKIIYEQLEQTVIYLNSDDFKEDLINSLHISESDLNKIITDLKSDEEFKSEIKGEKGDKGDPGKDFTYEDFTEEQLESLRGQDGDPGKDGEDGKTPIRGTDYWTESDILEIQNYCKNYIDSEILGGES
jgi:hypothetical protein